MTNSFFGFTSSAMNGSMNDRSPTTPWAYASAASRHPSSVPTAPAYVRKGHLPGPPRSPRRHHQWLGERPATTVWVAHPEVQEERAYEARGFSHGRGPRRFLVERRPRPAARPV